jgi:hypothetical protein
MGKSLEIIKDHLKETVKGWCHDFKINVEQVTNEEWSLLFRVLNDRATANAEPEPEPNTDVKYDPEAAAQRQSQLLNQDWISEEQLNDIAVRYCEMGGGEMTDEMIPEIQSAMGKITTAVGGNDPMAWKSMIKELTGEDIGDHFDIHEEDDDEDEAPKKKASKKVVEDDDDEEDEGDTSDADEEAA